MDHADLADSCGKTPQGCPDDEIDSVGARALATDVMIGLAAGAAVAAVVLFFVEGGGDDDEPASTTAWVSPTPNGGALGISTRF